MAHIKLIAALYVDLYHAVHYLTPIKYYKANSVDKKVTDTAKKLRVYIDSTMKKPSIMLTYSYTAQEYSLIIINKYSGSCSSLFIKLVQKVVSCQKKDAV
jgi:hypothetical protein